MMVEKNNRQVLAADSRLDVEERREKRARNAAARHETAMKIADQGFFWVGTEHKTMPYGTILQRPDVCRISDSRRRSAIHIPSCWCTAAADPDAALHGRRRHGRMGSLLHAGRLSASTWSTAPATAARPIIPTRWAQSAPPHLCADHRRHCCAPPSSPTNNGSGTGDIGDPVLDQFMAGQNAAPQDNVMAHRPVGQPRSRTARQNRPRHYPSALRRRPLRLAGRQRAAQTSESHRQRRRRRRSPSKVRIPGDWPTSPPRTIPRYRTRKNSPPKT